VTLQVCEVAEELDLTGITDRIVAGIEMGHGQIGPDRLTLTD
jgi:hypothetical protein